MAVLAGAALALSEISSIHVDGPCVFFFYVCVAYSGFIVNEEIPLVCLDAWVA